MWGLIADATDANYISVGSALGSVGFAVWYGWYVTTRTIPKIVEDHQLTSDKVSSNHRAVVDKLVTEFREEQREERRCFTQTLDTIANRFVCQPEVNPGKRSYHGLPIPKDPHA
jgi:hypothetical protein